MNVLSLFDGLSVGHIALDRAGKTVDRYYSSEIDTRLCSLVKCHYPKTIQLGDVNKYADWHLGPANCIDLLIGGSPCQDLSVCSGQGKGLKGAKSGLFWKYVEILNAYCPKYFLLENVKMPQSEQDVISNALGVKPVEIDSADYSPQTRKRLYWTNIPILPKPLNGKNHIDPRVFYKLAARDLKPVSNHAQQKILDRYVNPLKLRKRSLLYNYWNDREFEAKAPTLTTYSGSWSAKVGLVIPFQAGYYPGSDLRFYKINRYICEYLQTLPDNYTFSPTISSNQAIGAIGNAWTADVIAHIFKGLP